MFGSRAYRDGIAAEEGGKNRSGDTEIDVRHLLTNAIDIKGAASHPSKLFGNEQELNPELVRIAHVPDDFDGAFVALVEFNQRFVGKLFLGEVSKGVQTKFQGLGCNHRDVLYFTETPRAS